MTTRLGRGVVVAVGMMAGALVLSGGVALVLTDRADAVTAAMVGGLALVAVELAVTGAERLEVVSAVGGTWVERWLVVGASVVAALGVALLVGSGGRPSAASVLAGTAGIVAFIGMVGVQAFRGPGRAGKVFVPPTVGDTDTSRIEFGGDR